MHFFQILKLFLIEVNLKKGQFENQRTEFHINTQNIYKLIIDFLRIVIVQR